MNALYYQTAWGWFDSQMIYKLYWLDSFTNSLVTGFHRTCHTLNIYSWIGWRKLSRNNGRKCLKEYFVASIKASPYYWLLSEAGEAQHSIYSNAMHIKHTQQKRQNVRKKEMSITNSQFIYFIGFNEMVRWKPISFQISVSIYFKRKYGTND